MQNPLAWVYPYAPYPIRQRGISQDAYKAMLARRIYHQGSTPWSAGSVEGAAVGVLPFFGGVASRML